MYTIYIHYTYHMLCRQDRTGLDALRVRCRCYRCYLVGVNDDDDDNVLAYIIGQIDHIDYICMAGQMFARRDNTPYAMNEISLDEDI